MHTMFFDEINTKLFALAEKGSQRYIPIHPVRKDRLRTTKENGIRRKQQVFTPRNGKASVSRQIQDRFKDYITCARNCSTHIIRFTMKKAKVLIYDGSFQWLFNGNFCCLSRRRCQHNRHQKK